MKTNEQILDSTIKALEATNGNMHTAMIIRDVFKTIKELSDEQHTVMLKDLPSIKNKINRTA